MPPTQGAARAKLNATIHNLSHPAGDGGAGGDGDGGTAVGRLPPRWPKRVKTEVLREKDPLSASTVLGNTCGSSTSSPPSARGHIFDISGWSCNLFCDNSMQQRITMCKPCLGGLMGPARHVGPATCDTCGTCGTGTWEPCGTCGTCGACETCETRGTRGTCGTNTNGLGGSQH